MGRLRRAGNLHHRPRRKNCLQTCWADHTGQSRAADEAGDREGARRDLELDLEQAYFSAGAGSTAYRISSGYCRAANTKVSGTKPNNLKFTQKSVDCVRQIASLSTASTKKNTDQRSVSLRQPSSVRWNTESKTIARNC